MCTDTNAGITQAFHQKPCSWFQQITSHFINSPRFIHPSWFIQKDRETAKIKCIIILSEKQSRNNFVWSRLSFVVSNMLHVTSAVRSRCRNVYRQPLVRYFPKLERSKADGQMNGGSWREVRCEFASIEIDEVYGLIGVSNLRVVELFRIQLWVFINVWKPATVNERSQP